MARIGRPPVDEPRINLTFRVTVAEKAAILREAQALGIKTTAFLRGLVRERLGIAEKQGQEKKE